MCILAVLATLVIAWRRFHGLDLYAWVYLWNSTHDILPGDHAVDASTKLMQSFVNPTAIAGMVAAVGISWNIVAFELSGAVNDHLLLPQLLRDKTQLPFQQPALDAPFSQQVLYSSRLQWYHWNRRRRSWFGKVCDAIVVGYGVAVIAGTMWMIIVMLLYGMF